MIPTSIINFNDFQSDSNLVKYPRHEIWRKSRLKTDVSTCAGRQKGRRPVRDAYGEDKDERDSAAIMYAIRPVCGMVAPPVGRLCVALNGEEESRKPEPSAARLHACQVLYGI